MEKETVMFLMSMSNSMSTLWPAPIEMDLIDEGKQKKENSNNYKLYASRWSICSDIIRLMIDQMTGCHVDVAIAKSTDLGVSVTRGNSNEKLQPLLNLLTTLKKTIKANGESSAEFAIREVDKFNRSNSDITRKKIHWFVDAEMFVNMDTSLIDRKFPPNLVTLYVIGELRTLHNDIDAAKKNGYLLKKGGVNVQFLTCCADLNELTSEILADKRFEMSEKNVKCLVGKEKFKITLLRTHKFEKPGRPIKSLSFVGFLAEIELCRLGFFAHKSSPESLISVSVNSKAGNDILWSFGKFMLADQKRPLTSLFKCHKKGTKRRGYCIMVAHHNGSGEMFMSLVRLRKSSSKVLKKSLKLVDEIDEPSDPLPDSSYQQIAPVENRQIKRRLTEIEKLKTPDLKKRKYEKLANEYKFIGGYESFQKHTAGWQRENGLLLESETKDDNNN